MGQTVWFWHKVKTRIWQIKTGRKVIEWTLNIILRKEKQFHLLPVSTTKGGTATSLCPALLRVVLFITMDCLRCTNVTEFEESWKQKLSFLLRFFKWPKLFLSLKLPVSINKSKKLEIQKWYYNCVYRKTFFSTKIPCRSYAPPMMLAFWQKLLVWSCGFCLE